MTAVEPSFLDVDDVLEIHAAQLEIYGGGSGLRSRNLLEAAEAQPQAGFGGQYVHDGLFAMAAAYLKRAGLLAALIFLDMNVVAIHSRQRRSTH